MTYTKEDVVRLVAEKEVQFISLTFCDVYGKQKNITIVPSELERAMNSGISLDASQIIGFQTDAKIDLLVRPDPSTLADVPRTVTHMEHGNVMRMFCNIFYPNGQPFENDTRAILQKAVEVAKAKGYTFNFGPAIEFYLMSRTYENGESVPYDFAGYMDSDPLDRCEFIRRTICQDLTMMNIQPECAYHEEGPGQNKIKFHFADPVTAADAVIAYKDVVQDVADRYELIADFSAKPLEKYSGNSMHVNMSIQNNEGTDLTPHIIAGILYHISDMTLFLNPTKRSYRRLNHDNAPKYVSWSDANRSTLIRIPAYGGYTRFELRSPDNDTNPYIAFALLIYAALYGIEEKPMLQAPNDEDLFLADPKSLKSLKTLPQTLQEAMNKAKNSAFIQQYLPKKIIETYLKER